ncbi:glycosyltransferase [Acetobacteraceae bacterium ESL0709]|nr:glycosyltransferase [Acetobacteraceae bacterium ESL0697]MDF7677860.1 glycosyltransferase [Acetobacteraceae bacterium ESL0709]
MTAFAAFFVWLYLIFMRGYYWLGGPWLQRVKGEDAQLKLSHLPAVSIIVPARDEEATIDAVLKSLLTQDYKGTYNVILVNDESQDATSVVARTVPDPHNRLTVIDGAPRPQGWSGKLWGVYQGQQKAFEMLGETDFILLTDADIIHEPDHLSSLVTKAVEQKFDLVSEMVMLNCTGFWEKLLVPAFVYFFALLYPFRKVVDPSSLVAGAAGGTVLLQCGRLKKIGGIQALRGALIDDCTLAAHVKKSGGRLYLGCSQQARSIRQYETIGEIWHMIARNAYVQLEFSPWRFAMAILGMCLVWLVPVCNFIWGKGKRRWLGGIVYAVSCASFIPTVRWFNLSLWRILPLPLVAVFYMMATTGSVIDYYRGVGVNWRGRSYDQRI